MNWSRALVTWVVIIVAESIHGVMRQIYLLPLVGDLRARQIGVFVGSAIVFAIAMAFSRWIGARTLGAQLAVGLVWVALTVAFEFALGTMLGLTRERMLADYDIANGGLMGLGLLFMLSAPALAARLRR